MTRQEDLSCAHEPFGDAFYFGPEHLGARFANEPKLREESGFVNTTYKDVLDSLLKQDKVSHFSPICHIRVSTRAHR